MNLIEMFRYRRAVRLLYRQHEIESEERSMAGSFY